MAEAGAAPGRRPNPVLGDEPAVSYLTALRRWPDEVAVITRTALAARMGVQPNVVTNALNHSRGWRATPGRLRRALEIIEKCDGTSEDLDRWTRYHAEVEAYEVRGRRGPLPVPPEPSVSGWSVDARVGGARREPPAAGVPVESVPASMATHLIEPSSALGPVRAPSGLLRAERGVVEFRHRDAVLAELRSWLEGPAAVSVRVLTGPGGQGKTRLAAELVAQRQTAGWVAGPLAPELPADEVAVACQAAIPLLLVVDYAEGRIDDVVQLLAALVPDRLHPARVLLVSRSAGDWLDEAREHEDDAVADLLAGDVEVPLPPILPRPVDRPTEFVRALAAFARELGTTTAGVAVPDNFDDDRYGCALDLHAAALAALLDRDDSAGPLGDPVARVLHHERRFWRRTLPGFDLPDPHAARLDALVATATAFGADDQDRAAAVLGATSTLRGQLQDVLDRYLAWFRDVYPGQTALGALRPDRLGEDHVADVLRTRPDVLTGPMAVADARQRERALTVLGRAVARHADVAIPLARLLATDPGPLLALGARVAAGLADPMRFTAVMGEVAGEIGDVEVLWTLAAGLPETSLFLADYTAVVAEGLRQACEHNDAPLDELAVSSRLLAKALITVDRPEAALAPARAAVDLCREIADTDPLARVDVADALVVTADALGQLGQHEDAAERLEEALTFLSDDSGQRPMGTAIVLARLGHVLARLGQDDRAIQCATAAVDIATGLVATDPFMRAQVSSALSVRGELLWERGRFTEAIADHIRASELRGQLAAEDPDPHARLWIEKRLFLAGRLADIGRAGEAEVLSAEALADSVALVDRYGVRYLPDLASAQGVRAGVLKRQGQNQPAYDHYCEAITVYRSASRSRPELWLPILAGTLYNRASVATKLGLLGQAVEDEEEAADILRKLADRRPDAHVPDLIRVLMDLWSGLSLLHRDQEALAVAEEALGWARSLPSDAPAHLLPVLLLPLHGLTSTLVALDRDREAVVYGTSAAALARRVLHDRDDPHMPAIASELPNLGDLLHLLGKALANLGRHRRAVRVFSEAVGVYRAQARHDPAPVAVEQAHLDNDLAMSLSELGRHRAAHSVIRRAERSYRGLLVADRAAHLLFLVMCLGNVAAVCLDLGDRAKARAAALEATALARESTPDELGTALVNQACVVDADDLPSTVAALAEALAIAEDEDDPELREWALSVLGEHPVELVEPLWPEGRTLPTPDTWVT